VTGEEAPAAPNMKALISSCNDGKRPGHDGGTRVHVWTVEEQRM